ncbi:peptide ABC transporter substrate-binding protein [Aerococcaceae bacterium NML191292]|nr:peptide ABC transporter substrate-binding protein [Aerococcaceae bacterium NML191292]MCW6674976.1 peptide ABC transporter substrate-binding protein [Aerococcaceae bacterium NML171108]MCW6676306.1 peptide ABC transporter substrate-binding protein [Aerococcaceae bacterium NML180378]
MKKFMKKGLALGAALLSLSTFTSVVSPVVFAQSEQVLNLSIISEPPTADPGKATDSNSGALVRNVFEGLVRPDKDGKLSPAVAESWEVSEDGKVYTFKLRPEAKWSNGDPVKASDFEFSWKRVLNPDTAAEYATQLYLIEGAEAYNTGDGKPEDVGVKALDDTTLEVTLKTPTAYFLELTSFYTFYPVHQATVEANEDWANDAGDNYVTNGPFSLAVWNHDVDYQLVKNEHYWDADNVQLSEVNVQMIESEATANAQFQNGDLDYIGSPYQTPSLDAIDTYKEQGQLNIAPLAGVYWYKVNTTDEVMSNVNLRKALALAMDRQGLVENITKGGQIPALGIVPPTMEGFKEDRGYFKDGDFEEAKGYLGKALEELGLKEAKELTLKLSINTSEAHSAIAQYFQEGWAKNLGINVEIDNSEWQVYLEKISNLDYQLGRLGWIGDYNDASTFLGMYATADDGNNDTGWENPEYKALLEEAAVETDVTKRLELLVKAESVLMNELPVLPVYYYTSNFVHQDKVKNMKPDSLGSVDLKYVTVEE